MVFCAPFLNGKPQLEAKGGKLTIIKDGNGIKFLNNVDQISFSGKYAAETGQIVWYVTERAVFKLEKGKVVLKEIAPGVDLQKDVLAHMEFAPVIADDLKPMDAAIFNDEPMRKNNPDIFPYFPKK